MAEEYFDIVDADNRVIGQELRSIVHQTGLWHRGVHVFLFAPNRQMLVQKRSQDRDKFPGTLDCSVSEHVKPGESYLAAARRGLQEELGLSGIPLTRLVQFKMHYGPNDNEFSEVYVGEFNGEAITIDTREVESISFYTLPKLEKMIAAEEELFAPWFVQLVRWYTGKPAKMEKFLWTSR